MATTSGFQFWLDGRMQPIRTREQLAGWCAERGLQTREVSGRFLLLDMSLIPAEHRSLFDSQGFFIETEVTE